MGVFNRLVAILLWLTLLIICCISAVTPFATLSKSQASLVTITSMLRAWQGNNPTNFLIAQLAFGVVALLVYKIFI